MDQDPNGRSKFTGECAADVTGMPGLPTAHQHRNAAAIGVRRASRTLDELDGRTHAAQHAKELVSRLVVDLGGSQQVTVGRHELIKRAAVLGALIEDCEVRWLRKEPVEINEYLAAINAQRRVLVTIGLERRARDVTSLGDILRNGHRKGEALP